MIRLTILSALAVFLAGCATTYLDLSGMSAQQVANNIESQSRSFRYFSSSGYGNFETPQGTYSTRFDLVVWKPSSAHVSLYGPLGIKMAQVELTSDTLLVYNSIRNEVFIGKPTEANLRNLLMIATNGSSFTDILLGLVTPLAHLDKLQSSSKFDGRVFSFTYVGEDTVEKYTVDGEYMRTRNYEKLIDGETVMKIQYSDFMKIGDIYFPRSVSLEDLKHGVSAKLFYQDIAINEKDNIEFTVPSDAKKVILN